MGPAPFHQKQIRDYGIEVLYTIYSRAMPLGIPVHMPKHLGPMILKYQTI
jgi:hypothetical protein